MNLTPVLTIAGSDSSGGAGIQADIKTMMANGVYAESVITTLTAQNTLGVHSYMDASPEVVGEQIDAVFNDITPAATKIGLVCSANLIDVIAQRLKQYGAKNVVVDPVLVSKSGTKLLDDGALEVLAEELFPLATVITPNIPELEALSGEKVTDMHTMADAAKKVAAKYNCAVLAKGGHLTDSANDVLVEGENIRWFRGQRINTNNTHGTGCTLSSAIAANLAKGDTLVDAISKAKKYVTGALQDGMNLGKGNGPLNHAFNIK